MRGFDFRPLDAYSSLQEALIIYQAMLLATVIWLQTAAVLRRISHTMDCIIVNDIASIEPVMECCWCCTNRQDSGPDMLISISPLEASACLA